MGVNTTQTRLIQRKQCPRRYLILFYSSNFVKKRNFLQFLAEKEKVKKFLGGGEENFLFYRIFPNSVGLSFIMKLFRVVFNDNF